MVRDPGALELLGRAASTARSEGPRELYRRSFPVYRRRRDRLCRRLLSQAGGVPAGRTYLRARRRVNPESITDADPFIRLWIDPDRIDRQVRTPSKRWGRVDGGDWDRDTVPLGETAAYSSVEAHFNRGVPWRETAEFEQYRDRFAAGEQPKGCATADELETRFQKLDAIYERIATDGYRSQPELWAERPDYQQDIFYKWDRTLDPRLDEITVSIGRDGAVLHGDRGDHRLAIARLLDLEEIPVLVRRRHARWQSIRDELSTATRRSALTNRARANLGHPDVRELHGFDPSNDGSGTATTVPSS